MSALTSEESEKRWKDSIPATVFLNHFFAIAFHLHNSTDKLDLKSIKYFNRIQRNPKCDLNRVKKVLWNSWSTEYALRLTGLQDDSDFYRYSIHWNFPQAYYSVYLNMHAFYISKGIEDRSHDNLLKAFSKHVISNQYPQCISFHLSGGKDNLKYSNLNFSDEKNSLTYVLTQESAENQIAVFLKSTRRKLAEEKKEKRQASSNSIKGKNGKPLSSFSKSHWEQVYSSIHETTLLDLLYRLRIKSNYEDIQTFINADIDFKKLHKCLCKIVGYMNLVHEAYLAKCIGYKKYSEFVNEFPCHFETNLVKARFEKNIISLIK